MNKIRYSISFLTIFLSLTALSQSSYDSLYLQSSTYKNLTAQFELSQLQSADIVMLGNSITYGGQWNDLLGRTGIANRGIGGDNTLGMLHRMHSVYQLHPKVCFIMAGINDLYADISVERTFSQYIMIIDTLRAYNIIPIVQSTLYVNPKWKRAEEKNKEVALLNTFLLEYTSKNHIEFVDLNAAVSVNHELRNEFTTDGVHLTAAAYKIWRAMLEPLLKKFKL